MQNRFTITMDDGTTETVNLTFLDQIKAEEKAHTDDWGDDPKSFRRNLYAMYWHLRHTGKTTLEFEAWAEHVVALDAETNETPKAA